LLDEAENQGLLTDNVLRSILDGGYEPGGTVDRAGEEFPVYFPCAYALRGELHDVPSSILSRSHVINMQRGTPSKRFDRHDHAFAVARDHQMVGGGRVRSGPDMRWPSGDPRVSGWVSTAGALRSRIASGRITAKRRARLW
jgi:hypothetical protein